MGEGAQQGPIVKKSNFQKVYGTFYFSAPLTFTESLNGLVLRSEKVAEVSRVFSENAKAATNVGSLPFLMAAASVDKAIFNRFALSERLRAEANLEPGVEFKIEDEAKVRSIAQLKHSEFVGTVIGINRLKDDTISELAAALENEEFRAAAEELLRETIVMLWGAFETLCSDLFRLIANNDAKLAMQAVKDTKGLFPSALSMDILFEHGFNVFANMGDVLLKDRSLDSLPAIRALYKALFGDNNDLISKLVHDDLWILWNRRHVIVHRRGIIDDSYLHKTGDKNSDLGKKLHVDSKYVDKVLISITNIAIELLKACDALV